jgi:hypothetical protein
VRIITIIGITVAKYLEILYLKAIIGIESKYEILSSAH